MRSGGKVGLERPGFGGYNNQDKAMSWNSALRAAAIVFLTATAHPAEPGVHFKKTKSFASEREYRQSLGKPFRIVEKSGIVFHDESGKESGKVSLAPESDGYERIPLIVNEANVIFRLWRGYEAAAGTLEMYGPTLESKGTWNLPSLEFGIFPDGAAVLVAGKDPQAQYGGYNGDVAVVSSTGGLRATIRTGTLDSFPHFTFSGEGSLAAVLACQFFKKKASISIVGSSGQLLGRFESKEWCPLTGDIALRPRYYNVPLARLDEINRVVVSAGNDLENLGVSYVGVSLEGKFLWKWVYDALPKGCQWTLVKKPRKARLTIVGICPSQILLTDLEVMTGIVRNQAAVGLPQSRRIDFAEGFEVSADGRIILNVSRQTPDQTLRSSILFGNDLEVLWREEFPEKSPGEFFMGEDGVLAFRQEGKVHVGNFVP